MLTSPQNPRLQRVRALLEKRKQRDNERAFVIEGVRLAEEALNSGWMPELVLYTAQLSERGMYLVRGFKQIGAEVIEIAPHLMDGLTETEAPQGLLAILPTRPPELPEQLDFIMIADNMRDPGNLGALLRSAAAAGVQAVLLSPGTTDAFAPKVLRAGMGAHFRLPVLHASWGEMRAICKNRQPALRILIAEADQGTACWDIDLRQPVAVIVGNEAEGATSEALALADQPVTIPMPGKSESLNAAVAASILLFEVVRQRREG